MWVYPGRSVLRKAKLLRGGLNAALSVSGVKFTSSGACCSETGKKWRKPNGFDTGLKVFNSLTKQKEPLILAREGLATWYCLSSIHNKVCNVTFMAV